MAFGDRGSRRKQKLGSEGETMQSEEISNGLLDLRLTTRALESSNMISRDDLAQSAAEANSVLDNVEIRVEESNPREQDFSPTECSSIGPNSYFSEEVECLGKNALRDQDGSQHLNEELQLLRAAVEMLSDGQHPLEYYFDQLNDQVQAKRHKLKELESEWDAIEKPMQEKKRNLEQSLFSSYPKATRKLMRTKEIELETKSVLAEIKRREEELSKLSSDLEKQPKLAPRRSYIERVNEITKNSRKQDNDIQQILKDTRELQLESNTIQERLNRTYAIVDEKIFREAKKDPVARQAYRLLSNIHETFEQTAEKILATDRTRRDAADYEAKLAIISARSLNMGKVQSDLDAMRQKNELLERRLHQS